MASHSASERNCSTYDYIHSKLHNRLAPERVEKLVHIFFNVTNMKLQELAYSQLEDLMRDALEDVSSNTDKESRHDDFVTINLIFLVGSKI